ncbi:MAG: hypothetical protein KAJ19_24305, partial [Gammaproteobacteria bacterium]|nr:hypothetical protein [Gammaproteobacteria bacterium]
MSLIFSDGQIKNITKDTLLLPILIDDPVNGTGYIQQRDNALILKDSLFLTDQDLKVFSDLWISVVGKYHIELDWLKADLRSDYSELILQSGGQQTPPHFPSSPPWINLSPKVADSNTGLPIAPSLSDIEMIILPDLTASISTLKTGFSEGSFSAAVLNVTGTQFEIVYVDGSSELGDLAIGQQIIIYGSGLATLAEITGIQIPPEPTPPETEYDNHIILYDVISGHTGSIGGATVANSHPGFTNAQRGRQEAISGEQEAIRAIFEADVDNNVGRWEIPLSNQKDALDSNNELEPRKTANTAALVNVEAAIGDIVVWEALPVIDPNGKYTDTGFNSIETQIVTRTAQVPGRILEIEGTQLGTLIQDGAGDFTGAGVYFDLFTF